MCAQRTRCANRKALPRVISITSRDVQRLPTTLREANALVRIDFRGVHIESFDFQFAAPKRPTRMSEMSAPMLSRIDSIESIESVDFLVSSLALDAASPTTTKAVTEFRLKEIAGTLLPEPLLLADNNVGVEFSGASLSV